MLGFGNGDTQNAGMPTSLSQQIRANSAREFGLDLLFSTTLSFSYGLPSLKIAHSLNGESHVVIWHLHAVSQKHTSV